MTYFVISEYHGTVRVDRIKEYQRWSAKLAVGSMTSFTQVSFPPPRQPQAAQPALRYKKNWADTNCKRVLGLAIHGGEVSLTISKYGHAHLGWWRRDHCRDVFFFHCLLWDRASFCITIGKHNAWVMFKQMYHSKYMSRLRLMLNWRKKIFLFPIIFTFKEIKLST